MTIRLSNDTLNYLKNDVTYVSGSDGKIFFNNVLVDECFDIQYMYREMKEPVYGYRDSHFAAMLPGTVIVTGQFSINYIHDAYLYTIMGGQNISSADVKTKSDFQTAKKGVTGLSSGFDKKSLLEQYNDLRKKYDQKKDDVNNYQNQINLYTAQLNDLQAQQNANDATLTNQKNNIDAQKANRDSGLLIDADNRKENANNALEDYNVGLSEYESNKENIQNGLENYGGDSDFSELLFTYSPDIASQAWDIVAKYEAASQEEANLQEQLDADPSNEKIQKSLDDIQSSMQGYENSLYSLNEQYHDAVKQFIEPTGVLGWDTLPQDYARFDAAKEQVQLSHDQAKATLDAKTEAIKNLKQKAVDAKKQLDEMAGSIKAIQQDLKTPHANQFVSNFGNSPYKKIDTMQYLNAMSTNNQDINFKSTYSTMAKKFEIEFVYNDIVHKKIVNAYLMGYSHDLSVGGTPIREVYTFVASDVVPA